MNLVVLIGRLVKDPEVRYTTADNTLVCTFSLAVNRPYKKDETDFFNIVAWSKTGEFCSKYFKKGKQVAIQGRLQTRSYEDKEKRKVYVTEVIAEQVFFADSSDKKEEAQQDNKSVTDDDLSSELPF